MRDGSDATAAPPTATARIYIAQNRVRRGHTEVGFKNVFLSDVNASGSFEKGRSKIPLLLHAHTGTGTHEYMRYTQFTTTVDKGWVIGCSYSRLIKSFKHRLT